MIEEVYLLMKGIMDKVAVKPVSASKKRKVCWNQTYIVSFQDNGSSKSTICHRFWRNACNKCSIRNNWI